jgi:hypothetical protein
MAQSKRVNAINQQACWGYRRPLDSIWPFLIRSRQRKSHLSIPSFLLIVLRHRFRKRASIHILPEQLEFNIPTRGGSRTQFFGEHSKLPTAPLTEYPPSTGLAAQLRGKIRGLRASVEFLAR